jgi:hypothetical protein|tara:strand:- start:136 stop:1602 length:1467 start_codon:yes stop_codon:yes gene_type:complete
MNKEPISYIDWLEYGRVIIPCLKGTPRVKKYTDPDFKIEKDIWKRDYETAEIALRLDHDVDLDIDNEFVKRFLPYYIKDCGAIFGREGNPTSHYLWTNRNQIPFKQFNLPDEFEKDFKNFPHGSMICELRTEKKRYTIVPGSLHSKSKTNVRWEKFEEIREYQGNLSIDVGKVALSAALTIIYPSTGSRDDYCTAIAGVLVKNSDWTDDEIDNFVSRIAEHADDEDLAKRLKKGTSSRKTNRKFGINKLHEITGYTHQNLTGLFNWIGLFKDASLQVSKDTIEKIEEYGANRYYVHLNVPQKNVDGVGLKTVKKKIWIDGESLMNLKLFCDIAMSQAKVWIPRMTPKEFEEIMMAKFYSREQSKEYVKEAEEDSRFKMFFLDYLDTKGVYMDKEQLAVYKLPYYNQEKRTIEFDLNNFEKELMKNRVNLKRQDLVHKVQTILKGERDRGKYKNKSCVAWVIKGEEVEDNKLIWEGESVYIGDSTGNDE